MITRIFLLVSEFKNYGIAGIAHSYNSVSSLYYVKQIDNGSYVCDLAPIQCMFDCSEVFRKNNFPGGNKGVYDPPNKSFQNSYVNVNHYNDLLLEFSASNARFCQNKYNHILNVEASVFHMVAMNFNMNIMFMQRFLFLLV